MFEDSKHNYKTSVNGKNTDEELKQYFVNTFLNVGQYPIELMRKCISIEIHEYKE